MGSYKSDQPRANPPICWGCDRMLQGSGRFYVMVDGHPYHKSCAPKEEDARIDTELQEKGDRLNGRR